jgi:hypothetical protein
LLGIAQLCPGRPEVLAPVVTRHRESADGVALSLWRDLAAQITGPADYCCDILIRPWQQNARRCLVNDVPEVFRGGGSRVAVEA